jgi:hypothetical protein
VELPNSKPFRRGSNGFVASIRILPERSPAAASAARVAGQGVASSSSSLATPLGAPRRLAPWGPHHRPDASSHSSRGGESQIRRRANSWPTAHQRAADITRADDSDSHLDSLLILLALEGFAGSGMRTGKRDAAQQM